MQIDIGKVVIDAVQSGGGAARRKTEREREGGEGREEKGSSTRETGEDEERGKENRFAQSAFVGIQDLMD